MIMAEGGGTMIDFKQSILMMKSSGWPRILSGYRATNILKTGRAE